MVNREQQAFKKGMQQLQQLQQQKEQQKQELAALEAAAVAHKQLQLDALDLTQHLE